MGRAAQLKLVRPPEMTMNPLERILGVESRLNVGAITVVQAGAELFSGPKHWHTPWWKAQRRERLGVECATCASASPPLVLQHTWQPRSWREALREAGPLNWEGWKERHPLPKVDRPAVPATERPVCPTCGSVRVYFRKKAKDWACSVGMSGAPHQRHPDHTFPEPSTALRTDTLGIRKRNRVATSKYEALSHSRWQAWLSSPEYRQNPLNALRLRIEDTKRYLSFADTKTLCRRCAAREDRRHILKNQRRAAQRKLEIAFAEFDLLD
jgi:hypothetical protein